MRSGSAKNGLVWLALDGVGWPADAPPDSPWEQDLPALRSLLDSGRALDARLDVPGLPQSGTGQSCWLTGQNAVKLMDAHFGPQPGPTLQRLLSTASLPVRLTQAGGRAGLVNRYSPQYLAAPQPQLRGGRNRLGCFPYAFRAAGLPLGSPNLPLLSPGLGLTFERPWAATGTPDEVRRQGQALGHAAADWDLLVADLWLSDLLGHAGRADFTPDSDLGRAARDYLRRLDALLTGLLDAGCGVILSSDHGNFEDLHVKSHTLARVPFAGTALPFLRGDDIVAGGRAIAACCGLE